MDDSELLHALTPYDGDVLLEVRLSYTAAASLTYGHRLDDDPHQVQRAHKAFCGWDDRAPPGNAARRKAFDAAADELLALPPVRAHSDTSAAAHPSPRLGPCTHYRGGTGEVLQFTNVGQADTKHAVTASRAKLPHAIRSLPEGT